MSAHTNKVGFFFSFCFHPQQSDIALGPLHISKLLVSFDWRKMDVVFCGMTCLGVVFYLLTSLGIAFYVVMSLGVVFHILMSLGIVLFATMSLDVVFSAMEHWGIVFHLLTSLGVTFYAVMRWGAAFHTSCCYILSDEAPDCWGLRDAVCGCCLLPVDVLGCLLCDQVRPQPHPTTLPKSEICPRGQIPRMTLSLWQLWAEEGVSA